MFNLRYRLWKILDTNLDKVEVDSPNSTLSRFNTTVLSLIKMDILLKHNSSGVISLSVVCLSQYVPPFKIKCCKSYLFQRYVW